MTIVTLCRLSTLTIVGMIPIEPYTGGSCMTVLLVETSGRTSKVSIQELKTERQQQQFMAQLLHWVHLLTS